MSTFLETNLPLFANLPCKVADLSADTIRFGRKELDLAGFDPTRTYDKLPSQHLVTAQPR